MVLDFWASWCGAAFRSCPRSTVWSPSTRARTWLLVAVNLQETRKTIRAALERLKVKPTVVLDQDGAVAAKYAAVAILKR